MSNEKNAISKQDGNSRLELSASITDLELKEVVGGYSSHAEIDKENKIVWVVPENGAGSEDFLFQVSREANCYSYINDGHKIKYGKDAEKGKQAS